MTGIRTMQYSYTDANGKVLFEVHRIEAPGKEKRIYQTGPGGVGRPPELGKKPLYRLHELISWNGPVLVVEGEKCVSVQVEGYFVTTWAGGAHAVNRTDWTPLEGREVLVWPDADEAGWKAGREIQTLLPQARVLRIEGKPPGWDLYDCVAEGANPIEFVRTCGIEDGDKPASEKVSVPAEEEKRMRQTLLRMGELEFERSLKDLSKEYGVGVSFLRRFWKTIHAISSDQTGPPLGRGRPLVFKDPLPREEPVSGVQVLDDIVSLVQQYVVLPDGGAELIALWTLYTWCFDYFNVSPNLAFAAPEKGSGKTTALSFVSRLVRRALSASNISPAAIYRVIETGRPTLLIDEAETFIRHENHELRGILNSGFTRATAEVIRTVEENGQYEPRRFSTWCPKCFAFNGTLPSTLMDRTLTIRMQRKLGSEKVRHLLEGKDNHLFEEIKERLATWSYHEEKRLRTLEIEPPSWLGNREADLWSPLMAIAEVAGGHWPETVRSLTKRVGKEEDEDLKILLLRDIRKVFQAHGSRIHSADLAAKLRALVDSPWQELGQKGITPMSLSRMLKPFGIKPRQMKIEGQNLNGYEESMFAPAFLRYLPENVYSSTETTNSLAENEIEGRPRVEGRGAGHSFPGAKESKEKVDAQKSTLCPDPTYNVSDNLLLEKEICPDSRTVEEEGIIL